MDWLQANMRIVMVLIAGAIIVLAVGLMTDSMPAVLVTGFIVGIIVGGAITIMGGTSDSGS